MNNEKIISKFKNYWLTDSFFRALLMNNLRQINDQESIFLSWYNARNIYPDLDLSPNEVSCFLSGFFFNTSSYWETRDPDKPRCQDPVSKNKAFNRLGRSLGHFGAITWLYKQAYQKIIDFSDLHQQPPYFLEKRYVKDFLYGRDIKNVNEQNNNIFIIAGFDSRKAFFLQSLADKNVFNISSK